MLAKIFFGISQLQLRKLAYEFAEAKNIKHIFSIEKRMVWQMLGVYVLKKKSWDLFKTSGANEH